MLLKSSSLFFPPPSMISIIFCFQASLPWTFLTQRLVPKRKVRDSYADFGTFLLSPAVKMHWNKPELWKIDMLAAVGRLAAITHFSFRGSKWSWHVYLKLGWLVLRLADCTAPQAGKLWPKVTVSIVPLLSVAETITEFGYSPPNPGQRREAADKGPQHPNFPALLVGSALAAACLHLLPAVGPSDGDPQIEASQWSFLKLILHRRISY